MQRFCLRAVDALGRRVRVRAARRSARRGAALILLYHRIAEPAYDPWGLAVSPATFDRQLDFLASEFELIPLSELVAATRAGRVPERAVALTFDDGYVDNLEQALPLLERHRAPATLYVATAYTGKKAFWWDELQALVAGRGERPARLELKVAGHAISVDTATEAQRRDALAGELHTAFREANVVAIEQGLAWLREWAGPVEVPADAGRPMRHEELARIATSGLVELGAHSVHHASVPALSVAEQFAELAVSRDAVAELTGGPTAGFSFPFGDNDPLSRLAARRCGFDYAVGVGEPMPLTAVARRFELPRLVAVEEPAEALAARIAAAGEFRRLP